MFYRGLFAAPRRVKKVLALVMAFAMAFTMMASAGAAYTDQADIEATEAVEMLNALGVMTGDPDGSFRPNDTITRAEACRMIYTIRTNSDNADQYADMQTTFKDVAADAWYAGYVKHCQAAGIVSGTKADGSAFEPSREVTTVELALMCLRVMGYDPAKADIGGSTWSTKTIGLANEAGLLDDVNTSATAACPRQWSAQLMYNMTQANTVEWSTDTNTYSKYFDNGEKRPTVGQDNLNMWTIVGTLTGVDTKSLSITQSSSDVQDTDKEVRGITGFTDLPKDYSDLLGQKVKVMISDKKSNKVLGVYAIDKNKVYEVNASKVEKDDNKVKIDGKSYSIEGEKGIATYIDGVPSGATTLSQLDNNELNPNQYTFVDTDNNGKIDTLVVKTFNVAKVTYAASDKIIAGGKTYKTADENIAEDIEKDDWVVITENLYNDQKDIVKADLATGTLNGLREGKDATPYFDGASKLGKAKYNEYRIGDEWYKGGREGDKVQSTASENDLNTVKAGNDVEYVVVNDILFYVKRTTGENAGRIADAAMIVRSDANNSSASTRVKLAFFDGTTKTVDLDSDSAANLATLNKNGGAVYEFDVSGNEYSFGFRDSDGTVKKLRTDKEYYGDLTYCGDQTDDKLSDKLDTFDSIKIDDNAQVLLYKDGESKKISGKQFKSMDKDNIEDGAVYGFKGDMNGLERIGALAVTVKKLGNVAQTWNNYGYIVEDAYKLNGTQNIQYTFWNGSENVTVREKHSSISDRTKGTVIGYDTLTTEDDVNTIDDVAKLVAGTNFDFTAITKVSDDKKKVQFTKAPVGASTSELDVAGTVMYIDSDAAEDLDIGLENGEPKEAQKFANGNYKANAIVLGSDDETELLIVDQGEFLENDVYKNKVSGNGVAYGDSTGGTSTDGNEDASSEVENIQVSRNGTLSAKLNIERADWMAEDNTVSVDYEIYVDGAYDDRGMVTVAANQSSANIRVSGYYDVDASDIEIEITGMTAAAANVKYVDEKGNDITGKLEDGYTKTLAIGGSGAAIGFQLNTNDSTDRGIKYDVTGVTTELKDQAMTDPSAAVNKAGQVAKGGEFVVVTIKGLDKLIENKTVSVATAWSDNSKTIGDVTGGSSLADEATTIKISKPGAAVTFPSNSMNVDLELTAGGALTRSLEFTLNNGSKIVVKKGATTGTLDGVKFTDSMELAITSVKEVAAPTIVSIDLVKSTGDPISNGYTYAVGDKIVVTFSEAMDTTKKTTANLISISGTSTMATLGTTATWSTDGTILTITTETNPLKANDVIKVGGQGTDDLMSVNAVNVVSKSYTVGVAGAGLEEVVTP